MAYANSWVEKMVENSDLFPSGVQQPAITNFTATGTYADDDDAIATAINSILAVLRTYGMIKT